MGLSVGCHMGYGSPSGGYTKRFRFSVTHTLNFFFFHSIVICGKMGNIENKGRVRSDVDLGLRC